ncbi:hypothetical protein LY76DRAFT_597548 [Colletotrichum caudatum]|nr:hypothetical protein LY76DRAFT_597548 [Colletotrichum caudatum]
MWAGFEHEIWTAPARADIGDMILMYYPKYDPEAEVTTVANRKGKGHLLSRYLRRQYSPGGRGPVQEDVVADEAASLRSSNPASTPLLVATRRGEN